jgi:hypothetical protein
MLATALPGRLGRGAMSSHAGDGAVGATRPHCDAESCWKQCCRVMLATALPGRLGCGVMPSHAGDGAVESCWRWCYQGDMVTS